MKKRFYAIFTLVILILSSFNLTEARGGRGGGGGRGGRGGWGGRGRGGWGRGGWGRGGLYVGLGGWGYGRYPYYGGYYGGYGYPSTTYVVDQTPSTTYVQTPNYIYQNRNGEYFVKDASNNLVRVNTFTNNNGELWYNDTTGIAKPIYQENLRMIN
jgi:hypothetical protein